MGLSKQLSGELKQESANTKKILERVPEDKLSWKPHEKSMSMGRLAHHVAELPIWIIRIFEADDFDFVQMPKPVTPTSTKQIMEEYEKTWAKSIQLLETTTDEYLETTWKLKRDGQTLWEAPRRVLIRNFINHLIHHRGQLTVYLRLQDVPLPGLYGPTADER